CEGLSFWRGGGLTLFRRTRFPAERGHGQQRQTNSNRLARADLFVEEKNGDGHAHHRIKRSEWRNNGRMALAGESHQNCEIAERKKKALCANEKPGDRRDLSGQRFAREDDTRGRNERRQKAERGELTGNVIGGELLQEPGRAPQEDWCQRASQPLR